MSKPSPHSIFEQPNDHFDWDKYIEQVDLIELSAYQKKQARRALSLLRSYFGEFFLKNGYRSGHPLLVEFVNSAPMARLRLIRFAKSLGSLQKFDGFDEVLKRLKNAGDYLEAASVVETAMGFYRKGFEIEFEPRVEVVSASGKTTTKRPDFILNHKKSGEQIVVEVSRLRQSAGQTKSAKTFNTVWGLLQAAINESTVLEIDEKTKNTTWHHIRPCANILRDFDDPELLEIVKKIQALIAKVAATNSFCELTIKDKIEVAIAPHHEHSKADEWARQRGIRDLIQGPQIPNTETHRTRMKIGVKTKQLPRDRPGIIIIPTTEALMFFTNNLPQIVNDIESELWQYPHLLFVVLTSQSGESGVGLPEVATIGNHLFVGRMREDFVAERKILVTNPSFNLPILDSTVDKLKGSILGPLAKLN